MEIDGAELRFRTRPAADNGLKVLSSRRVAKFQRLADELEILLSSSWSSYSISYVMKRFLLSR